MDMKNLIKNKFFNIAIICVVVSGVLWAISGSSYSIGNEYCWVDPNMKETQRVGLTLKIQDKKNGVIQFKMTHVMSSIVMQSLTSKFNETMGESSEERLKNIIAENTLTKGACGELYSKRQELDKLLAEAVKIREQKEAEAKIQKEADEKLAKEKLAVELEQTKEFVKEPNEIFCLFGDENDWGRDYSVVKYIGIGKYKRQDGSENYEFVKGIYNSKSKTIEPSKSGYNNEPENVFWTLEQIHENLFTKKAIRGKDACVAEMNKVIAEENQFFDSLNLKLNQVICSDYSYKKIVEFSTDMDSPTTLRAKSVRVVDMDTKGGRVIASDYGSKTYLNKKSLKENYNFNEAECLKKAQEDYVKKQAKETF